MLIKDPDDIAGGDITPPRCLRDDDFWSRLVSPVRAPPPMPWGAPPVCRPPPPPRARDRPPHVGPHLDSLPGEQLTSYEDLTRYNNFYELGTSKRPGGKCRVFASPSLDRPARRRGRVAADRRY